jgi:tetratricopeptide (TPR) repeat protein
VGLFRKTFIALLVCLPGLSAIAETSAPGVDALIEAGHWKRARQISLARVKANPRDAQAHAWLSKIASSFGDLDTAIREADRAVELDPRSASFHGQLAESCALMADRSTVLKGLVYARRMKREIDAALAIDPKHVDTLLVEMMFSWKAPTLAGGDKQKARRVADQILSISPVWGYLAHARLYQFQGDTSATESALKRAVQADPGFYRARVNLAAFYCGENACPAPATAEHCALEAIAVDPDAAAAYDILARAYVAQKRWADLAAILNRAEQAVPDDLGPYYAAARRLIETGQDFDRAEQFLQRYLGQDPEGREPTKAESHRLMADMYQHAGRKSDAFRELQLALWLEPDFEPAKRDLSRLRRF